MIERESESGKKRKPFFGDFTGFCRSELSKPRLEAALRDKSYGFMGTGITRFRQGPRFGFSQKLRKRRCPGKSRYLW